MNQEILLQPSLTLALTAGAVAFLIGVIWGGPFIEILKILGIGKKIRKELSEAHQLKEGTPTMGGIMIVLPTLVIALAINFVNIVRLDLGASILLPLFVFVSFAILGMLDDWEGIHGSGPVGEGMSGRAKFAVQVALGIIAATLFSISPWSLATRTSFSYRCKRVLSYPFQLSCSFPSWLSSLWELLTLSTSRYGLDGLAGTTSASAFAAYGVIAYIQGQFFITQLCFVIVGALFSFLWFNAHPAQVFMGDTGSLALGALLGLVAMMTGQLLLLPIIAIIPVAETLSVIAQVAWFRITAGQRLFRQAPLHGHFEKVVGAKHKWCNVFGW
ncbi:MAG UNVERIFIED_CONTAM: phospho-N-acetylmuramoyl-pentapeptide-transferase [Anaerolineae bacterium]|jgi:phospho-N-acetylmuramoyl-pentapeptide-transferase